MPNSVILEDIPYKTYLRLRGVRANRHTPMSYNNGTPEILGSDNTFGRERAMVKMDMLVRAVGTETGIGWTGTGKATFHRGGDGPRKGKGRERGQSYYLAHARGLSGREAVDLDAADPPPDLWIEVDHRADASLRLPVCAGLAVPEVWQYRVGPNSLRFLRLVDRRYRRIDRSVALSMLTPALVLDALKLSPGQTDDVPDRRLRAWARESLPSSAPEA